MRAPTLGAVPPASRRRLVDHYGTAADRWLDVVPDLLTQAALRWRLELLGYHDAGSASSIALARADDGQPLLVKAWYDHDRYVDEIAALEVWPTRRVPEVLHTADDLGVAALELIGGRPGGAARPPSEHEALASALTDLHTTRCQAHVFPRLDEYIAAAILPRIDLRLRRTGADIPEICLEALTRLDSDSGRDALLHGDLYRENVLFDVDARPVFIDPLPMFGEPAFDWAFWIVYYDLLRDPLPRLRMASAIGNIPPADLLPWCLTLCVDGLLYYGETGDPRAPRMTAVMNTLATCARQAGPC
jgi:streptomycin 6-kinase